MVPVSRREQDFCYIRLFLRSCCFSFIKMELEIVSEVDFIKMSFLPDIAASKVAGLCGLHKYQQPVEVMFDMLYKHIPTKVAIDALMTAENRRPFNKIKNNLTELANQKRGSADEEYAEEIANHAKDYADFARSPSLAPWARTVKSLGFAMTLGLNLSSAFVNLFTLPMAVYPYLSGKYEYGDTFKAMNRARKLYMSTGMRRKLNTFTGVEGGLEIDGPSLPP